MIELQTMIAEARAAMAKAYAPYSNFHVGACLKTASGKLFQGCNVENAAYGVTLCAEAVAIGQMALAGEDRISEIVVISQAKQFCAPCGACRQMINEFSDHNTVVHMCDADGNSKQMLMKELLPDSFGSKHLHTEAV